MKRLQKKVGVVRWFNEMKGYGMIEGGDGETYFAHYSSIQSKDKRRTLDVGQTVKFNPSQAVASIPLSDVSHVATEIETERDKSN